MNRNFDPRQRGGFTGPRVNERIRIPEIRVVGADGEMVGVLPTHEALRMAREKGLDLVEVNPKAMPPVCKIMDFGKFKYEEKKRANDAKKKQVVTELKEIKLRPKTDDHDIAFKVKHIRRFIDEGNKVKITIRFRGREITHLEPAERQIGIIVEQVKDVAMIEQSARMEGKAMSLILAPRPAQGSKPKPSVVPGPGASTAPSAAPAATGSIAAPRAAAPNAPPASAPNRGNPSAT